MTSGQEGTWEIFSKLFPDAGGKVDGRDTGVGVLTGERNVKMGKTFWEPVGAWK